MVGHLIYELGMERLSAEEQQDRGAEEVALQETHVDSRLAWLEREVRLHSRHKGKEVAGRVDAAPHTTPL